MTDDDRRWALAARIRRAMERQGWGFCGRCSLRPCRHRQAVIVRVPIISFWTRGGSVVRAVASDWPFAMPRKDPLETFVPHNFNRQD